LLSTLILANGDAPLTLQTTVFLILLLTCFVHGFMAATTVWLVFFCRRIVASHSLEAWRCRNWSCNLSPEKKVLKKPTTSVISIRRTTNCTILHSRAPVRRCGVPSGLGLDSGSSGVAVTFSWTFVRVLIEFVGGPVWRINFRALLRWRLFHDITDAIKWEMKNTLDIFEFGQYGSNLVLKA
jgi:hypothetical protein